ncbi:MAG: permease [Gammaproteobacteria bacterium]|nr:permease [Gammaproteobacteria bacterium]MBU1553619.1 permease [Gammaproteobacteria bacterium]MBU2069266.1 permease [Gammaproteobacteria bacterium]MBU2183261.1 permease [Gammaproteobacteria bacterium]MBU2204476.1 permease [Gammaproteobacteria bacterium]
MTTPTPWQAATEFFVSTFAELAVLFVLISLLVSVINYYLPASKVRTLLSGNRGYGVAITLGAVTPFCSCSTLPMLLGLLKARAAFGPLMAFLITSPLLNPFVIALFWLTFGAKVTLLYSFCVVLIATSAGYLLQQLGFERYIRQELLQNATPTNSGATTDSSTACNSSTNLSATSSCCEAPAQPAAVSCCTATASVKQPGRLATLPIKQLTHDALSQLRTMLPYMVLGVAVGAALHGFVPVSLFSQLASLNSFFVIPLAALIGIFLYVRASTMIPIATSLLAKGLSMGSVMSLTIAGAGASLPEMIMLKKIFHWPLLLAFVLLVLLTACITGISIDLLV